MADRQIILGITGASGAAYGVRLLDCLESADAQVHVIVSDMGRQLLASECGITEVTVPALLGRASERVDLHEFRDLGSQLASGSFRTDGMVVCPCSSNTLAAIASGLSDNLITRAAQVTLKEARRLILVHREMPLNAIDVENIQRIQRAGGIICPASPAFYHHPQNLGDLVDFVVGKVLDLLAIEHSLATRYPGKGSFAPPGLY